MMRNSLFKSLLFGLLVIVSSMAMALPSVGQDMVDVIIGFHDRPGNAELNVVKENGGKIHRRFKIIPSVSASIPAKAVARLLANPMVKIVEPDAQVAGAEMDQTWGIQRIGTAPVHDGTFLSDATPVMGAGVKVAVLDTGLDYTHSQFAHCYRGGYDFVNNDSDPFEDHRHGTHCAGTIAARKDGIGVVGVAPEVDLYAVKVLGADNFGYWSWIIAGVDWCVENNIQVASVSLGSTTEPGSQLKAAFDNANAAGIVVVACAGNSGSGSDTVWWPAKYDSVIAVAATTSSDARSSFSSTGPAVELAAPGSSVKSTLPGESYGNMNGTSMACPHVSGVAALMISAGIPDTNGNGRINDEVRAVLQSTAIDLGTSGPDQQFGHGLVDAEMAVATVFGMDSGDSGDSGTNPDPVDTFDPPTNLFGTVSGSTVSLSWEDNSSLETGFEIWQGVKVKKNTTWNLVQVTGPDATTADVGVAQDGKYLYRVRAFKSDADTNYSNQIQATVGSTGGGGKGGGRKK